MAALCFAATDPADFGATLTGTNVWSSSTLTDGWKPASSDAKRRIFQLEGRPPIFGLAPEQTQARYEGETLSEISITYLEAGNYFGSHAARDAGLKKAQKEFAEKFDAAEETLLKSLTALYGTGQRRNVGKSQVLRSRVTEFDAGPLLIRLFAEEDQLISIFILPASAGAAAATDRTGRRTEVQGNVARLPNGDVAIQNIPIVDQGERGYCAIGTLTMITRYYGLPVNVDLIAAKAGYKDGDVGNANLDAVYAACAREARLKMKMEKNFDFRKAKKSLLKGQPIVVGRKFDRVRDEFHTQFARQYEKDSSARLPKADRAERARWPTSAASSHMSIITGFNDAREEVLFTESWGEAARHRRMLADEMEATAFQVDYFSP
jgi:peptidase C39-like protein